MSDRQRGCRAGITLIETMVTVGLLATVFAITGTVMVRMAKAWDMQETYSKVTDGMRNAALEISQELESAAVADNNTLTPPLKGLSVAADGQSISFQTPASLDGKTWSKLVTIRLRSEDKNRNLVLDAKEDMDGNGVLDRVIERLEDLNGNGDYKSPGETRVLARGIDALTFAQDKGSRKVAVSVTARYPDPDAEKRTYAETNTFTVVVRN